MYTLSTEPLTFCCTFWLHFYVDNKCDNGSKINDSEIINWELSNVEKYIIMCTGVGGHWANVIHLAKS